jgi:hypothetical protein
MDKRISIGIVKGNIPADCLLRTNWVVKLGGFQPAAPKHGTANVIWVDKTTCWAQREDGCAIVAAGIDVPHEKIASVVAACPDPVLIVILAADHLPTAVWYETQAAYDQGRRVVVVGPRGDRGVPSVTIRRGEVQVIDAICTDSRWDIGTRRVRV